MKRIFIPILTIFSAGFADGVAAQAISVPAPPTKRIRIYNNSTDLTLNAFIQSPIISNGADLWMQAQFKVSDWTSQGGTFVSPRKFLTSKLYRAYVGIDNDVKGIKPGGWVEITVPFYTQLKDVSASDLGMVSDQFIDWWNANRIYLFDSRAAYHSAQVTNVLDKTVPGGGLPPPPVSYLGGAALPGCTSSDGSKCTVSLIESAINPPDGIPFQLQEYTFAAAEGPPLNNTIAPPLRTKIDLGKVNYNVSSLDSVFLPVAMGPLTKTGASVTQYVGTALPVAAVRSAIKKFSESAGSSKLGGNWPYYVPVYFDDKVRAGFPSSSSRSCSLAPFADVGSYNLPKIPGAFNTIEESYKGSAGGFPPVPPILSSNPANWESIYGKACTLPTSPPFVNPPALGTSGAAIVNLWKKCTANTSDTSTTCKQIRTVAKLFTTSFNSACPHSGTPTQNKFMEAVYGWVPIVYNGCTGVDLVKVADFASTQQAYCNLQYNYLTLPPSERSYIFNPYTAFIHKPYSLGGIASSAYAFSIDDKLSFKSVLAEGVIIAIGGARGLENRTATPLPTKDTIFQHCGH